MLIEEPDLAAWVQACAPLTPVCGPDNRLYARTASGWMGVYDLTRRHGLRFDPPVWPSFFIRDLVERTLAAHSL